MAAAMLPLRNESMENRRRSSSTGRPLRLRLVSITTNAVSAAAPMKIAIGTGERPVSQPTPNTENGLRNCHQP